ncbi:MAG: hemin-degrading factor [Bacteroidia bacterium]
MLPTQELESAWANLKKQYPHVRIYDAAQMLGVSELELLETQVGRQVTPLRPDFEGILSELFCLGPLMALSRNPWAVIESIGMYPKPQFFGQVGQFVSPAIDLRIFLRAWRYAYATQQPKGERTLYGLQFFDAYGRAIHKIYLQDEAYLSAYQETVKRYADTRTAPVSVARRTPSHPTWKPVSQKDFTAAWENLRDTHDFHNLLRRFGLSRLQALSLMEGKHTRQTTLTFFENLLAQVQQEEIPIMFFVGNEGILQIYTGTIHNLVHARGWINIMDPTFNLHLNPTGVAYVYQVRKFTEEGEIYSVELLDAEGEVILLMFGARKPSEPPPRAWNAKVAF